MTLVVEYRATTSVPVEVEGLTPDFCRQHTLAEIERFEIFQGNRKIPLAEMFAVSGDPSDGRMEFRGELAGVHWIGAKMTTGTVHVAGNVGRHVGSEMTGGEIRVEGDVGDWLGGEMKGGKIHVRGRAGHLVGAAYRGSRRGMTGGTILVEKEAGNEIGHTMRRGLIAIGGESGDTVGFNLLAGTILICGASGIRHGAGMRRGSIVLLGDTSPRLLPTFRRACRTQLVVLAMLAATLRRAAYAAPFDALTEPLEMYNGDFLDGGRGEIFVRP